MLNLSCPSCNTPFTLPALPPDRRAECPRCRDAFPIRTFAEVEGTDAATPPSDPPSPTAHAQMPHWSVQRSLLVAVAMGLIGLGVGLWLHNRRGNQEPRYDPGPQRPADVATPAAQLEGLRYLPADTNLAFAMQPGPFLAYASRTKQDPGELLTRAGLPGKVLGTVADLGLTLPQIDHLAGGTFIGDGSFDPRLTLALVLRQPLADEDAFLKKLKAKKQPGGKARYDAELAGLFMTVARVSPTVWVFGLGFSKEPRDNLEAVDRGGYELGGKQFRPWLAESIASRVPPDAAAWVAANDERWAEKLGVKFVVETLLKKPEWMPVLSQGRAGLAAVSLGEEPRVRLYVKAADDATGQRVRDYFKSLATDPKASHGGAGDSALYETAIDPATAYATLQKILSDAGKK